MAEVGAMRQGAIILCGGASSRMGRDKAWLPFGRNEVMLQRVVRLVGEVVPPENILCVAADGQALPELPQAVSMIRDPLPCRGPLAGLATGLAALEHRADAVFAAGCDVPLLVPAFVDRMFELLGERQVAVAQDGERCHPLSAVYRTSVLQQAGQLLALGERSLMSLVERCDARRAPIERLRDVDPELSSLVNCNTLDGYKRALGAAGIPVG
jgi:molybdopterin-guanine dinucleotide biosynthesis protein A